ncbi:MAG: YHS domain-containing protein [Thermoproteota archaeon]
MTDPVCKMSIDLKEARWRREYKGEVYYFCSEHCLKAFVDNPEKYVKK